MRPHQESSGLTQMAKKGMLILALFLAGLLFIYKDDILPQKKTDVYLVFDSTTDLSFLDIWAELNIKTPEDFDISKTRIESAQLKKLNPFQRNIYDSIKENYYSSPRKVVWDSGNGRIYSISLSYGGVIRFQKLDSTYKTSEEIAGLNIVTLDSAVKILVPLRSHSDKIHDPSLSSKYKFHIIDMEPDHNKFPIFSTKPMQGFIH